MAKYKQFYDRGFPFDTGHWDEFDPLERLDWLRRLFRRFTENDRRIARSFGMEQSDLDELAADIKALEENILQQVAILEANTREAEVRALLFEEILLRNLDPNTPLPITRLPSDILTKNEPYNQASVKELPPIIEKFAQMSDSELIAAGREAVTMIRTNIANGKLIEDEEFATRLSNYLDTLANRPPVSAQRGQ
ncbi:MAG: hypothetical protein ABL999_08330 [Pyrinomonadaceae bacterium]